MKVENSATVTRRVAVPPSLGGRGTWLAFLGVLSFSGSMPATVYAMRGLDPWLVAVGRAAVAGAIALICLKAAGHALLPPRSQWPAYALIVLGVVVGFPVFSGLALHLGASTAHSAVVIGLLPAATAACAVLRAGERPAPSSGPAARPAPPPSPRSPSSSTTAAPPGPTCSSSARSCRRRSATPRAAASPSTRPAGGSSPTPSSSPSR
ncbi:EamA family transporter [[Actinomadura] parvosata]|uniref:EamA family transporter n=1 Tax=[Actinomadura] parvosata TaxID=1955412 RepID=UPI001FE877B9